MALKTQIMVVGGGLGGCAGALAALAMVVCCSCSQAADTQGLDLAWSRHQAVGHDLDTAYYEAGSRLDVARYDLAEARRQGRSVPQEVVRELDNFNEELRSRWLALDQQRSELRLALTELPPAGRYVLSIEVDGGPTAARPWLGITEARFTDAEGREYEIPAVDFTGGAYRRGYAYQVPKRDAVFVYGRPSSNHTMRVGFDLPEDFDATGLVTLELTGLDDLKPGRTPVRVSLNGITVYRGDNGFDEGLWRTLQYPVPAKAFTVEVPRGRVLSGLLQALQSLDQEAEAFQAQAQRDVGRLCGLAEPYTSGLVYDAPMPDRDFWKHEFIRGMCVARFQQDEQHHAKWMHDLGVNLVYSYAGRYSPLEELPDLLNWTQQLGLPVFHNPKSLMTTSGESLHLGEPARAVQNALIELAEARGGATQPLHLAVDEPKFRDELAVDPVIRQAFVDYAKAHAQPLREAGVDPEQLPGKLPPVLDGSDGSRCWWMLWQLFRRDLMGSHFAGFWEAGRAEGVTPFTIIQFFLESEPQLASYSSVGASMPLVSTDIYRNGGYVESVSVQLLANANDGTTVLTAGSGYGARSERTLARSMAIAMMHADGLLEWTDIYLSKYREPKAFWRTISDDRGRSLLENWDPDYFSVTHDMYRRMYHARHYLGHGVSRAKVAVLLSERTLIALSDGNIKPIFDATVSTYAYLAQRGIPVDVRLVESTGAQALSRYGVVLLPGAEVLTESQRATLEAYVQAGGVLVSSGRTGTRDAWGRLLEADSPPGGLFVGTSTPAEVLAKSPSGAPVLTRHAVADGQWWHCVQPTAVSSKALIDAQGEQTSAAKQLQQNLLGDAHVVDGVRLAQPRRGMELQVKVKGDALIVHVLDWADGDVADHALIELDQPEGSVVFDPCRPGHPSIAVTDGRARVSLVHGHGCVVIRSKPKQSMSRADQLNP